MSTDATASTTEVIKILESPTDDRSSRTFIIAGEDHTLGNPLQFVLARYPEVQLVACTPTHPLEDQMLLRIQCQPGVDAVQMFSRGLQDVASLYAGIRTKYTQALQTAADA